MLSNHFVTHISVSWSLGLYDLFYRIKTTYGFRSTAKRGYRYLTFVMYISPFCRFHMKGGTQCRRPGNNISRGATRKQHRKDPSQVKTFVISGHLVAAPDEGCLICTNSRVVTGRRRGWVKAFPPEMGKKKRPAGEGLCKFISFSF